MDPEEPPANLSGVIARSRSRYKGNRPNQVVKNTQAPPKIRPEQLGQYASGLDQRQERRKDNPDLGASNAKIAPPTVSREVLEDVYESPAMPSTCRQSTNLPSASLACRPRDNIRQYPTQDQKRQYHNQRRGDIGMTKAGQEAEYNQTKQHRSERRGDESREHVVIKKLSSEFKAQQEDYGKFLLEHTRLRSDEVGDRHWQSSVQPVHSPPMPSEPSPHRKQVTTRPMPAENHSATSKPATLKKRSLIHRRKGSAGREELKRTISAPMAVESAEVSIKPAFDAPVSAVNAGERRVRVHFDQSVLSISVTPSTTPLDIIREASTQLSMPIDMKTNVLLESFKQLGLERPLRRYEHIRDVMNSWDNDSQNSLTIVPSPTGGRDDGLELSSVLPSHPGETSVHIYHSNAPGAWDKRWITLRSDGQVLMIKKDGKETSNICHLSDFDIYTPKKGQMAKKIKPPKKYCFAVKSQQKSAMFLSTENFVHFFAAGDRELAMAWHKAVQEWRSWYLVNIMGEGHKDTAGSGMPQRSSKDYESSVKHQQRRSSCDNDSHQQSAGPAQAQLMSHSFPIRRLPTRSHDPSPVFFPKKLTKDGASDAATTRNMANHRPSFIQHQPLIEAESEPFAAQGLLGRTYTQRQKIIARETRERGQGLGLPEYHDGNYTTAGGDCLQRKSSQCPKQKPLLDLTPKYEEPPQHRKKGHGVLPEHMPARGLVEAATNAESIMPNTVEAIGTAVGTDVQQSRTVRSQHPGNRQAFTSPEKLGPAFTGGLLSSAQKQGQDGTGTGHGVKTGDRKAREPLLDMNTEGPWSHGSLLDRVNTGDTGPAYVIDQAKRHEVNASVGEGR